MTNTQAQTATQNSVRNAAIHYGWAIVWDYPVHLRLERNGQIVHVEWSSNGRIRWATQETRRSSNASVVDRVVGKRDTNKVDTVITWLW